VLAAIDAYSFAHEFLISIGKHKVDVITGYIEKEKPKVVVELGGYLGYSAIFFADALRRVLPAGERFHVWSLEFEAKFAAIAEKLIDIAGLKEYVTVVVGPAEESLKRLQQQGDVEKVDMLFLDHVENLYIPDFNTCRSLGLFKKGSLIIADNVVRPGAPEYRELVRSDPKLSSEGVRGLIQPGNYEV
jgi:catechol O-methyltransferase